jgi:hypothetical protein
VTPFVEGLASPDPFASSAIADQGMRVVRGGKMCAASNSKGARKRGRSFRRYGKPDAPVISKHGSAAPTLRSYIINVLVTA